MSLRFKKRGLVKIELRAWPDTRSVDVKLIAENEGDKAILVLIRDRKPQWVGSGNSEPSETLVFPQLTK